VTTLPLSTIIAPVAMQESNATGPKDPKISSDSEEKEQTKDVVSKVQEQLGNHDDQQQEGGADFD